MHDPALLDFLGKMFAALCASVPLTIVALKGLRQGRANAVTASEIHILVNSQKLELERQIAEKDKRIMELEDLLEGQFAKFRALDEAGS